MGTNLKKIWKIAGIVRYFLWEKIAENTGWKNDTSQEQKRKNRQQQKNKALPLYQNEKKKRASRASHLSAHSPFFFKKRKIRLKSAPLTAFSQSDSFHLSTAYTRTTNKTNKKIHHHITPKPLYIIVRKNSPRGHFLQNYSFDKNRFSIIICQNVAKKTAANPPTSASPAAKQWFNKTI